MFSECLALRALGPWGERVVLASQLAFDYGAALSYLIITGDTATSVMKAATGGGFVGLRQLCMQLSRPCISHSSCSLLSPELCKSSL